MKPRNAISVVEPIKTMADLSREYNETGFASYRGRNLAHQAGDSFKVSLPDGIELEFNKLGQALRCVVRAPLTRKQTPR